MRPLMHRLLDRYAADVWRVPEGAKAVQVALAALPGARYFQHDLGAGDPAELLDAVGPVTTLVSNAGVPARDHRLAV